MGSLRAPGSQWSANPGLLLGLETLHWGNAVWGARGGTVVALIVVTMVVTVPVMKITVMTVILMTFTVVTVTEVIATVVKVT